MSAIIKTMDIRQAFLAYFKRHAHTVLSSSSLLPSNDPSLFFTNAGMVPFKKIFLGQKPIEYPRVATSQRCLRASGKHNDLEMVGYTNRHHTFFEMLGNFSFGDYGKREAIHYAWDFLTQELGIDPKKLWVTVHTKDQEAEKLWRAEFSIKNTAPQGMSRCTDKDNFWAMGETGPCGYCSEIFYDHGPNYAGDPPGGKNEGERYVEIWNLVFMQFVRDATNKLQPLPKLSIDTGMGLERVAAVMQGVHDNYATDVFTTLAQQFTDILTTQHHITHQQLKSAAARIALRVVTDHIRATVFLIADGVLPSNEKTGYVLRSIIRRAVYYLYRLGLREPCFFQLVAPVVNILGDAYPEIPLVKLQEKIATLIIQEEQKFLDTLERGLKIFNQEIQQLSGNIIPGKIAFNLHDTYGLPIILTIELARERGLNIDQEEFNKAMEKQRVTSRTATATQTAVNVSLQTTPSTPTDFVGYTHDKCATEICGIYDANGILLDTLKTGTTGIVVLTKTPYYAEAGGQVGDNGKIYTSTNIFIVENTQKYATYYLHYGHMQKGTLTNNIKVTAEIDTTRRQKIKRNHSATHLLHSSLHNIVGNHALQRGSYVDDKKLRFDFMHNTALTTAQLATIEQAVNAAIRDNYAVTTTIKTLEEAQQEGAQAIFGEKYGENVRVVTMGNFSKELCGGIHVSHTGEIGLCKIVSETSIAAGIRRIEALTGENALLKINQMENTLKETAKLLGIKAENLTIHIKQLIKKQQTQEKELLCLQKDKVTTKNKELIKKIIDVNGVAVLATELLKLDIYELRSTIDMLKQQLSSAVIVLATVVANKIQVVVGVTKDLVDKIKADELLKHITAQIDGNGGGKSDMAQGGGVKVAALQKALASVFPWVKNKL